MYNIIFIINKAQLLLLRSWHNTTYTLLSIQLILFTYNIISSLIPNIISIALCKY